MVKNEQNAQSTLPRRRQAEDELHKQSEWMRITLASIGDAVISTDAEGQITFMNEVGQTLTAWTQREALGRPLHDVFQIVNEHTRLPIENPAKRAMREGRIVALADQTILVARNGTERPIDDSAAPIRNDAGEIVGAVLVFRDVTERKKADEGLARLAAIVESSQDAIVSKTLDGIIQSWNAGAERLFGYKANEVIGKPITLIIPRERQDEELEILARVARGERIEHFETVRVTKDGQHVDISLTVSPVRDRSGRIVGASKVARDISDSKRIEQALREADQRKDHFIAMLAHELRNPLAPLRNGLQVMRLASSDPNAIAQVRGMMERQLGHLVRLVDDMLDISRISKNKMELRRSRVLLADVVSSAVETVRPAMVAAGHQLIISLPPEPVHLDADLTRLSQVLSNLLTNSAKYTEKGGRIWLTAECQDDEVVLVVKDTGIGIPATALPRIFDMFSQVDRSVERETGGLGIGLALVKGLVEMHNGTVHAASEGQGKGSTFTVRLPVLVNPKESLSPSKSDGVQTVAGPRKRILVVDDNRDSASLMAMMLKMVGNEVETAHDGIEALAVAEKFRPHAIFMDVGMPRLNGYDATRQIRERAWGKSILIIALTGWAQEEDKVQSMEAGCNGHLVKPVKLAELEKLVGELNCDDA